MPQVVQHYEKRSCPRVFLGPQACWLEKLETEYDTQRGIPDDISRLLILYSEIWLVYQVTERIQF